MNKAMPKHQIFECNEDNPLILYHIKGSLDENEYNNLKAHWHKELEITYIVKGQSSHYIDGMCIKAEPGKVIIVNSESVHSIIPDENLYNCEETVAIVLLISEKYLKELLPDFESIYFLQTSEQTNYKIKDIIIKLSEYFYKCNEFKKISSIEILYLKGLIHLLVYYICQNGIREKKFNLTIKSQENIERLKEILSYIHKHYKEPICEKEIAENVYLSPGYFCKFFKRSTGLNFTEYLTMYRLYQAKEELTKTSKSITAIAFDNGFNDSKRFINAFRKQYNITPLQYRKK